MIDNFNTLVKWTNPSMMIIKINNSIERLINIEVERVK